MSHTKMIMNMSPAQLVLHCQDLKIENEQLRQQRDELVESVKGARVIFDRLRTSKETQFSHVQARDGAMVHVHYAIASIDAALAKIEGEKNV